MKSSLLSRIVTCILCLGVFGTGLYVGERIARTPDRVRLVSHDVNSPIEVTPYHFERAVFQMTPTPVPAPTPAPAPTPSPVLTGAVIIGLAALVTTLLQGVKNLFPQIGGITARVIAVLLAIAGAITAAPAGQPPLVTAGAAATAALSAMGIYGLATAKKTPAN